VLAAAISRDPSLAHDGDGIATVELADVSSSNVAVRQVKAAILAPAPAGVKAIRAAPGWSCAISNAGHLVSCTLPVGVTTASSLSPINLAVAAVGTRGKPSFGRANLQVQASWVQPGFNGRPLPRSSAASLVVDERAPLVVRARAVDGTVTDPVSGFPTATEVLEGVVGRRTDEPITFGWRQLCGRGCARVRWATATHGVLVDGEQPTAGFSPPHVDKPQLLRFALTASDPRGAVSAVATVRVLPEQIERLNPRLSAAGLAGARLRSSQPAITRLASGDSDQAVVTMAPSGIYRATVDGVVRLEARVGGQHVTHVSWRTSFGPPGMLAGAVRAGTQIEFRAPAVPGTYAVRMAARTPAGGFSHEELLEVNPGRPAVAADTTTWAAMATGRDHAFCAVVDAARLGGAVSIPLRSGGSFTAQTNRPVTDCAHTEQIVFTGGRTKLGSFELEGLRGTITRGRGVNIVAGIAVAPEFWKAQAESAADARVRTVHGPLLAQAAQAGLGPAIPFEVPETTAPGPGPSSECVTGVGLGIPLTDGGFGDFSGQLTIGRSGLSDFPLGGSLPGGWKMDCISLSVAPDAGRFELNADASGPSATGGKFSLFGVLTFDGQVSVSVIGSNLAVLDSGDGEQATLTAQGTLTVLPALHFGTTSGYFPVIDVSVSAAINNYRPAQNMTLSGQVSWSLNGPFELAGTLVTDVKGTKISTRVIGSYSDANNWRLFAELSTGPEGLPIGNPTLLKLTLLQGELENRGGKLSISLKGEAADIHGIEGVKATSATVEFTTACQFHGELTQAPDGTRVCLLIDSAFEITLPGSTSPLKVSGRVKLDFTTLKFEVVGSLSQFGPDAFKLHDIQAFVTNAAPPLNTCSGVARAATAGGLSFGITAKGEVLGLPLNFTGAYLAGNPVQYCLGADLGAAELPTGSSDTLSPSTGPAPGQPSCERPSDPTLQQLHFEYSSTTEEGSFTARFCLPAAARERLGTIGKGVGGLRLTLSRDGFVGFAHYTLGRTVWFVNALNQDEPDPTKAAVGFRGMSLAVEATRSAGLKIGLAADGELQLPKPTAASGGAGTPASQVPLSLRADLSLGPQPRFSFVTSLGRNVAGQPCNGTTASIKDAFGAPGFNICQVGLGGAIGASGVELSANAKFTLPTEWGNQLGVRNASFEIGFNVSALTPCIDLNVQKANSDGGPALDLFDKGAIVADKARLTIAPNGCELPGRPRLNPGFVFEFKGTMFGTPTDVNLEVTRLPAGLKINFTQTTGASTLGPLKFGETHIHMLLDPSANESKLGLRTDLTIGQTKITFDGTFHAVGTGPARKVTLDVTAGLHGNLLGVRLDGDVKLHFESATGPDGRADTKAQFSGKVTADLRLFKAEVEVKTLTYDSAARPHPGLQALDFTVSANVNIGPASANGAIQVLYTRAPEVLKVSINGRWSLWGTERGSINRTWDLSRIEIPFTIVPPGGHITLARFPVVLKVAGDVSGALIWTPSGGFSVTTDFKAFRMDVCDPFEVLCSTLADLSVNRDTGEVTGTVLGIRYRASPSEYAAGEGRAQLPAISNEGMIVSGRSRKCVDLQNANTRDGTLVQIIDCHAASTDSSVPRQWSLAQRWELEPSGNIRDGGHKTCLDTNGDGVYVLHCIPGNPNQHWHTDSLGHFVGLGGKCLEVPGAADQQLTPLKLAPCVRDLSQRWAMSGALGLATGPWCAAGKDGSTATLTPLVLVRCDHTTTNYDFKTNPDGRLHVTDANCVDVGPDGAAVIRVCERGVSESTLRFEMINGHVKPAGVDVCLTAPTVPKAGASLDFKKCARTLDQAWFFGRVVRGRL